MAKGKTPWMALSGATGFTLFIILNFTDVFVGSRVLAVCLQLGANAFVFVCWTKEFRESEGFWNKFFPFFGVVVPPIMAGTTLWRVLIPALLNWAQ